jgi:Mn2+/Fe2+ NRAMP family transporter
MDTTARVEDRPAVSDDCYILDPAAIEAPPVRLGAALRHMGPGLILAGAIVGTGELIATTHLGAKVGFALLWLVIVSCFIKVFVQAELGRYTICRGQTTLAAFHELPGPGFIVGWWWVIMMLFSQLQMVGGVGQALHIAMPGVSPAVASAASYINADWGQYLSAEPHLPWAILTALGTAVILSIGGYGIVEKGSGILVAAFTIVTVLCVVLLPAAGHPIPWHEVGSGLKPQLPQVKDALAAALAMFGITGVGATELVAYPYWCIEKGYARKTGPNDGSLQWVQRARGWLRVMLLDVWMSLIIYTVATIAFYFLGAAVLHGLSGKGLPGRVDEMLTTLAHMYEPVMGAKLATVFIVIGVFAVLYSTLYASTGANSRTFVDFLHVNCGLKFDQTDSRRQWVRLFCIIFPVLNLILFMAIKDPVIMVLIGGFIQAITLPLLAAAALYFRYQRTDRRLAPGMLWNLLLWLSMIGLFVAAVYGVFDSVRNLL